MKKILIKNFPNLNNYGTAMMGLVTIQSLVENYGRENIQIYCSFDEYAVKEDIYKELVGVVELKTYANNTRLDRIIKNKKPLIRRLGTLWSMFFYNEKKFFDKIIILGGDDFSEYYSKYVASIELYKLWRLSKHTEIVMLGQTIGPFSSVVNRFVFKCLLPKMNVYSRDPWTAEYFKKHFNIKIKQMRDVAFNPLPLQSNSKIEKNILSEYSLKKDNYFTVIVSGLFEQGYYCKSEDIYLLRHKEAIQEILKLDSLLDKKIVLLAHTFPPYGDESSLIQKLFLEFSEEERERMVVIKEKILPTKARFILGNGLFSLTGRMHPAVSTLQMGKPSIMLSYSAKYEGVIGMSLNRSDLIIDANIPELWLSGEIVSLIKEKVIYVLNNYSKIILEIDHSVNVITDINSSALKKL
jgi:colanic acid/amylovoran biosynthesis protein